MRNEPFFFVVTPRGVHSEGIQWVSAVRDYALDSADFLIDYIDSPTHSRRTLFVYACGCTLLPPAHSDCRFSAAFRLTHRSSHFSCAV